MGEWLTKVGRAECRVESAEFGVWRLEFENRELRTENLKASDSGLINLINLITY